MVIKLINMPFGHVSMPSLGLTQITQALRAELGATVEVESLYLNMDMAQIEGFASLYDHVLSSRGFMSGLGDWLFRQVAFPSASDNTDAYLARYYYDDDDASEAVRSFCRTGRNQLAAWLDDLVMRYRLDRADMVGFTSLFGQTVASAAMAQRIKLANPAVMTMLGGPVCGDRETSRELVRQLQSIDIVFVGSAVRTLPAVVRSVMAGNREAISQLVGVCTAADEAGQGGDPVYDHAWAELAVPDYTDFLAALRRYDPDGSLNPALLFQTSEGCWWGDTSRCSFCGLHSRACRSHALSPDQAVAYLTALFRQGGERAFYMAVDSVMPQRYPREVFKRISVPRDGCVQYEVRPTLDAEALRCLAQAGVRLLQPGIESLSSATLRLMRKGITAFQNVAFLKRCSQLPVALRWNLLLFTPGETEATLERYAAMLPTLAHLHPPEGVFPVNMVRNSRYFNDPDCFGLQLEPQDFYALTYPADAEALCNLATVFVDRHADQAWQDGWLDRLSVVVEAWDARYFGSDGGEPARLILFEDGEGSGVYDSRSGDAVRYRINAVERALLHTAAKPCAIAELVASAAEADACLNRLRARGLLFEEDEYVMSLPIVEA